MGRKFQRRKENFRCEHCGAWVEGNGYTNHCPRCLWSKHVDVYPGDRAATCQGLMEPIGVMVEGDGYVIVHRCTRCGLVRRNRASPQDDFEALLKLAGRPLPGNL